MPAVAPGEWLLERDADGAEVVSVTFPRGRDLEVVREQLASWRTAVAQCIAQDSIDGVEAPLLLPALVENQRSASPVSLRYAAPRHSGTGLLSPARSPDEVFALLRRVAVALDVLHSRSFVHGALGVESLWEMHDGSLRFPDAGLTHVLDRVVDAPVVAGAYLAPEVWRGSGMLAASDQYSLAVIVFELFTGRGRLVQDAEGMLSIAPLAPAAAEPLYPGAPESISDVLQRALATSPAARFPSCAEFIDALQGDERRVASLETVHGFRSQRTSVWSVQTLVLGLVAAGTIVGAGFAIRAGARGRTASRPATTAPVAAIDSPPAVSPQEMAGAVPGAVPDAAAGAVRGGPGTAVSRELPPSSSSRGGGLTQDSAAARSRSTLGSAGGRPASPSRDTAPQRTAAPRAATATPTRMPAPLPGGGPAAPRQRTGAAGNLPAAPKGLSGKRVGPVTAVGPATGTLRLSGLSGSRYYVDGILVRPKNGLVTVPEGVHDINIVLPNRSSQRRRVTVHRGETVAIGR